MASTPENAAQAALLSAAISASNGGNVGKNTKVELDTKVEPITGEEKPGFSPIKTEPTIEPKREATTTPTEESETEMRYMESKASDSDEKDDKDNTKEDAEMKGIDWRPLRSRSFLTDAQVAILSTQFKRNPFPSKYELSALAEQIGVNKRVVQVGGQKYAKNYAKICILQ
jgi:hypothetical protein